MSDIADMIRSTIGGEPAAAPVPAEEGSLIRQTLQSAPASAFVPVEPPQPKTREATPEDFERPSSITAEQSQSMREKIKSEAPWWSSLIGPEGGRARELLDYLPEDRAPTIAERKSYETTLSRLEHPSNRAKLQLHPSETYESDLAKQGRTASAPAPEGNASWLLRRSAPVVASLIGQEEDSRYKAARDRLVAGNPEPTDKMVVREHEARQQEDAADQSTFGGKAKAMAASLPAILGESMIAPGGGGVTWAGRALGQAIKTPFMPSLYMGAASQSSVEKGGEWYSPQNIVPAGEQALVTNMVLGTLGHWTKGIKNPVARYFAGAGAGVGELEVGKIGVSGLDHLLPEAYETKANYGAIGDIARGEYGKGAQELAVNGLMTAAFQALHGNPYEARKTVKGLKETLNVVHEAETAARKTPGFDEEKFADAVKQETGNAPEGRENPPELPGVAPPGEAPEAARGEGAQAPEAAGAPRDGAAESGVNAPVGPPEPDRGQGGSAAGAEPGASGEPGPAGAETVPGAESRVLNGKQTLEAWDDPAVKALLGRKDIDKLADLIPPGSKPLNAGGTSVVLRTPEGGVVRIGFDLPRPNIPEVLQPTSRQTIHRMAVEQLPFVDTKRITQADVADMAKRLAARGYAFVDPTPENLGRTADGQLVVTDAGAVQKKESGKPRMTGEELARKLLGMRKAKAAEEPAAPSPSFPDTDQGRADEKAFTASQAEPDYNPGAHAGETGRSMRMATLPQGMGAAGTGGEEPPPPPGAPGTKGGAVPEEKPATAPKTKPWLQQAGDWIKSIGQASFPATTRISSKTGEKLARTANAKVAGEDAWSYYQQVLKVGDKKLGDLSDEESRLVGAAWLERRLRTARKAFQDAGDDDAATRVGTLVGQEGSPLKSETDYQDAREGLWPFWEAIKQEWTPEVEKNFRGVMGLEPTDAIDSLTQIPGLPLNLIPLAEGETPNQGMVKTGSQKESLANLRVRKPGFTRQASLDSPAYDIDVRHMMQRTLALGTEASAKADLLRTAIDEGVVAKVGRGEKPPEGFKSLPFDPSRGLPGLDPNASYYAHPDAYTELVTGLGIGERPGRVLSGLSTFTNKLTSLALQSPVEIATHVGNHVGALFEPGMGLPIYNLKDSVRNFWNLMGKDPEMLRKVWDLSKINASFSHKQPSGILGETFGKWSSGKLGFNPDPTYQISRFTGGFIDLMQKSVRVQLGDAYDSITKPSERTETGKRDFINKAVGNYNTQASNRLVQFVKDSGLQGFATAATTFTAQGVRRGLMMTNADNASLLSRDTFRRGIELRATTLAKLLPVMAIGPVVNYLRYGEAFPDHVPVFAMKTDSEDPEKVQYFDPLAFVGLRRGWNLTGVNAAVEGMREDKSAGDIATNAFSRAGHAVEHAFAGPPVEFAHILATGENLIGRRVAEKPSTATTPQGIIKAVQQGKPEAGTSQAWLNLKAALLNANPLVGTLMDADRPKTPRTLGEDVARTAGPFGVKERSLPVKRGKANAGLSR